MSLVLRLLLLPLLFFCFAVQAKEGANSTVVSVAFLGVFGGANYDPTFSRVFDSDVQYSQFWVDPALTNASLKSFSGIGGSLGLMAMIGGNFTIDFDVTYQYRDDEQNNNSSSGGNLNVLYLHNQLLTFAFDIGYIGSSDKSSFGWAVSIGAGIATNTQNGQYPVYASLQVPNASVSALDHTFSGAPTMLYYDNADFSFYFGQLKASVSFKPIKNNDGTELFVGYRGIYSQQIDVTRDDASDFYIDLPTVPTTCTAASGGACPAKPYPPIDTDSVIPPLNVTSYYYLQQFTYRSNAIEIGVRIAVNT